VSYPLSPGQFLFYVSVVAYVCGCQEFFLQVCSVLRYFNLSDFAGYFWRLTVTISQNIFNFFRVPVSVVPMIMIFVKAVGTGYGT